MGGRSSPRRVDFFVSKKIKRWRRVSRHLVKFTIVKKLLLLFLSIKERVRIYKRPIIYIMSINYRFSVDTFYFGLKISAFETEHLLEFINYYLFFFTPEKIEYNFSKNRFYHCSYQNPEKGISIFFRPRKNCHNDYICFELTGKFFKDIIVSKEFLSFIFETFGYRVNFQRIDIAIDCIYDDVENVPLCEKTHLLGFPFPSYSENWRYQRIPFEMYGRIINNCFYINMVYQGKNDVRLRVYDKQLDLMDKYKETYSNYYSLDIKDSLVYRIELQMRSDKLKNYMMKFWDSGIDFTFINIVSSFVTYIFNKYNFSNIDFGEINIGYIRDFTTYIKKDRDLIKRMDYYRKQMFNFYNKYIDTHNEYYYFKDLKEISNIFKKNLKNSDFNSEISSPQNKSDQLQSLGQYYFDFYSKKFIK